LRAAPGIEDRIGRAGYSRSVITSRSSDARAARCVLTAVAVLASSMVVPTASSSTLVAKPQAVDEPKKPKALPNKPTKPPPGKKQPSKKPLDLARLLDSEGIDMLRAWMQRAEPEEEVIRCRLGFPCPYSLSHAFDLVIPRPAVAALRADIDAVRANIAALEASLATEQEQAQREKIEADLVERKTSLAALEKRLNETLAQGSRVEISGVAFAVAAAREQSRCDAEQAGDIVRVLPEQEQFDYCGIEVAPGDVIVDGNGRTLETQEFAITGVGQWGEGVEAPAHDVSGSTYVAAQARYSVDVTEMTEDADGTIRVKGTLGSIGSLLVPQTRSSRVAFSYAGLKVVGGPAIGTVSLEWTPNLAAGLNSGAVMLYDPVSIHVRGKRGPSKRTDLMRLVMGAKGEGGALRLRPDGFVAIDAVESAELLAHIGGKSLTTTADLELAVVQGKVGKAKAGGAWAGAVLPAAGAVAHKAGTGQAHVGKATLTGQMPKATKLDIIVPKMRPSQKFELRLGGGGFSSAHE
jgi:hypothetical protein